MAIVSGAVPVAADFFRKNGCSVKLLSTPQTVTAWNAAEGAVIGMSHVTC